VLDGVCELLAPALSARSVQWRELAPTVEPPANTLLLPGEPSTVIIPTAEEPRYALQIAQLTGGRRLLSDDVAMLEAVGVIAGRRIDAIRFTRERYDRAVREQEVAKLASEAELRALRAQVNPHFLFNALTTIGYLIEAAPARALETLLRLTALLRGVLRSDGEFTTLGRELEIVESYLEIERARFEHRLAVRIDVPPSLHDLRVPVLVLQPLVENAVKHGISRVASGGEVAVVARMTPAPGVGDRRGQLELTVRDTGAGSLPGTLTRGGSGLGLRNVERRLACQYSDAAALTIDTAPGRGTTVTIRMPAEPDILAQPAGRSA
jgi:two-component system LytT family sensor kinase